MGIEGGRRDGALHGALSRLEPLAPPWLVAVVAPKRVPAPWSWMVRYAIAIGGALLAGVLLGRPSLGALFATGALTASFGDQGGPFLQRLPRIAAGLAGAVGGLLLSRLLADHVGVAGVLLVAAAGVVSAYLSAISAIASFAGLQLLVNTAVGAGLGAQVTLPVLLVAFLAGAAWSVLVSGAVALVRPETGGPRPMVVAVLDRLQEFVAAAEQGQGLRAPRARLASALADAWDAVTAARAVSAGRRNDLHRLAALIGPASQVARAAAADPRHLDGLRDRVRLVRDVVARTRGARPGSGALIAPAVTAAIEQLERVAGSTGSLPGDRPRRRRGAGVAERLLGRRTAVFAVRIALCLAVAESLRLVLPLSHPYWLLLTVAVVLKPDLGSVFARGVQRAGGTLVGVLIGIAVLAVVPPGPLLLIPVTVIAFLFPLGAKRNYGMLATFVTPLVLILVDLAGAPTKGLAASRLLDTVLGAAIVLLVGYLPWPSTWRPRLGSAVADAVEAVTAYARVAIDGGTPGGPVRRRAFSAVQDLRADLQSALAEPPPGSRYAAAWWPVMSQVEQIAEDLRGAHLVADRDGGAADDRDAAADTAQLVAALREVGDAMRSRRPPRELPVPTTGPLGPAGQDVAELRRLLQGPVELPRRAARRGPSTRPAPG